MARDEDGARGYAAAVTPVVGGQEALCLAG